MRHLNHFDESSSYEEGPYVDKYQQFKHRWRKISDYGDLVLPEPLSYDVYLFPEEKGYLLELKLRDRVIGSYHSYYDEDEGLMNDAQIGNDMRGIGLGKVLLLKAIDVSNSYLGFNNSDARGLTTDQKRVYDSLHRQKAYNNDGSLNYDKAQEIIMQVIK